MFTAEQTAALAAKLDGRHVKSRTQSGRALSYIEGWTVIDEANRIFGFDGWTRETVETRVVAEYQRKIGKEPNQRDGWGVSYVCRVRVRVIGQEPNEWGFAEIVREGIGSGHGIDADLGLAHESAVKEAETDAMKRALMTFGNPFGLALYDKAQEGVEKAPQGNAARAVAAREPAPEPVEDPFAEIERNMLATIANMTDPNKLDRLAVSARFSGDLAHLPDDRRGRVEKALRTRRDTLANPVMAG
jgi:DNA recombination protein Rad52